MIVWDHDELSVRQQCHLLSLSRSGIYYEPVPETEENLMLMSIIDKVYLKLPFYGSRRMAVELREHGHDVNRKRMQRLMRLMGLEGLAPGPNTSRPAPEHAKYPYLLRSLLIYRANQVWATDITYIPMAHGFLYLVAVIDWFSRRVLAWRLSNTLESGFCVEAAADAARRWGKPEIFNMDQGAQFTSEDFLAPLRAQAIRISMDGKGRCIDNIFVERLWRSLKYEEVFLHAYADGAAAQNGIGTYLRFFNEKRPHMALKYRTPAAIYNESMTLHMGAA